MGPAENIRASWENVAGWWLPYSVSDGPSHRSPTGPWSCFAHTETGAVLAGYDIAMRVEGVAEDWQSVVRQQTVAGPGQVARLRAVPSPSASVTTVRGFTVAAYSDARATVAYYLQTGTLQASCTIDVVWQSNDWRLQLADDGSTGTSCTQGVPASFTAWGPPA